MPNQPSKNIKRLVVPVPVEVAEEETYVAGSGDMPTALKVFMEEMRGDGVGGVRFKKLPRSVIAKAERGMKASIEE